MLSNQYQRASETVSLLDLHGVQRRTGNLNGGNDSPDAHQLTVLCSQSAKGYSAELRLLLSPLHRTFANQA